MKITNTNGKRINKKGLADNFFALLFVILGIALIFGCLFLFMYGKLNSKQATISADLNIKEGLYTTRILLNQEIMSDYKVYDAVIDSVNNGNSIKLKNELYSEIKSFYYMDQITDKWLIIINDACFIISAAGTPSSQVTIQSGSQFGQGAGMSKEIKIDECEKSVIDKMPKVTVPNPDGENILVLFKPVSELDGKSARIFGYRADQLKGISQKSGLPEYSVDGRELKEISGIPNVICDVADTSVGKICLADERLVAQLELLSAEKLQKENMQLKIIQAYRTYEIQKRLYDKNCNAKGCTTPTCNPDASLACPHMRAGAVDINLYDSTGKNLNEVNPQLVENIMCGYGFVRFSKEDWHFEYGTNEWDIAEEKRANGEKVCRY